MDSEPWRTFKYYKFNVVSVELGLNPNNNKLELKPLLFDTQTFYPGMQNAQYFPQNKEKTSPCFLKLPQNENQFFRLHHNGEAMQTPLPLPLISLFIYLG